MKVFMFYRFVVRPVMFYNALFVLLLYCNWACSFTAQMNVRENGTVHDMCGGLAERGGFRCINRKILHSCPDSTPYVDLRLSTQGPLANEENVTVTVSGILHPTGHDWVALISPSIANISSCPQNTLKYKETGDLKSHPLLCHYPIKAQFLKNDASYISCAISSCKKRIGHKCLLKTCTGSITFNVINIRTDIEFVVFRGGFDKPCILKRSKPLKFANPIMPLYAHLSSMDSTGTAIKISWISGDNGTQYVQYGVGQLAESSVTTFTRNDMCERKIPSAAKDFGWHDPGYIHTAQVTGLLPSRSYLYTYGSDLTGWSSRAQFSTPPSGGTSEVQFLAFGDMGQAPRDASDEHYIQPGSLGVIEAITEKVLTGELVDSVFHIGDLSYATGFLVEWDYFLQMINPVASRVPYMTAIGNHERDFPFSGSKYKKADSGGECGVPYEKYFHMPIAEKDKPWYSINQGPVHFTVISTEHNWARRSEQYNWIKRDLASADRKQTPWIVFCGHRPMYSTGNSGLSELVSRTVDPHFVRAIEPLLMKFQVDLVLWGHVHNYERTCSVFKQACRLMPTKDLNGVDTYNNTHQYSAPVHVVIGTGGFSLDKFKKKSQAWSLVRRSEYGYADIHAKSQELLFKFVSSKARAVEDSFKIIK